MNTEDNEWIPTKLNTMNWWPKTMNCCLLHWIQWIDVYETEEKSIDAFQTEYNELMPLNWKQWIDAYETEYTELIPIKLNKWIDGY